MWQIFIIISNLTQNDKNLYDILNMGPMSWVHKYKFLFEKHSSALILKPIRGFLADENIILYIIENF
jgi:hypothetical protein